MSALANYFKPTAGRGAYYRDVPQKAISGFGSYSLARPQKEISGLGAYYKDVPQKAIAGLGSEEESSVTVGGTVGTLGLIIRGLAGYYLGGKVAAPLLGLALGGLFGMPGIFALVLWKAPAVAVANKRRKQRRRARRLSRRSR